MTLLHRSIVTSFALTSLGLTAALLGACGPGEPAMEPGRDHASLTCEGLTLDTRLSDEFNDAAKLAQWTDGPSTAYDVLDVDSSEPGHLAIVPTDQPENGWYQGTTGPFRFKQVSGDFVAVTRVRAGNASDHAAPPTGWFNSAGLLVRDPASTPANANWIAYNLGHQDYFLGTEAKRTVASVSELTLTASGSAFTGTLGVCRVGDTFYTFRLLYGQAAWQETQTLSLPASFPDTAQVGPMVNGWMDADLFATFDFFRIGKGALSYGRCLAAIQALAADPPGDSIIVP